MTSRSSSPVCPSATAPSQHLSPMAATASSESQPWSRKEGAYCPSPISPSHPTTAHSLSPPTASRCLVALCGVGGGGGVRRGPAGLPGVETTERVSRGVLYSSMVGDRKRTEERTCLASLGVSSSCLLPASRRLSPISSLLLPAPTQTSHPARPHAAFAESSRAD
eukprot:767706-Hanusia_phi.AAC.2